MQNEEPEVLWQGQSTPSRWVEDRVVRYSDGTFQVQERYLESGVGLSWREMHDMPTSMLALREAFKLMYNKIKRYEAFTASFQYLKDEPDCSHLAREDKQDG